MSSPPPPNPPPLPPPPASQHSEIGDLQPRLERNVQNVQQVAPQQQPDHISTSLSPDPGHQKLGVGPFPAGVEFLLLISKMMLYSPKDPSQSLFYIN